MFLFFGGEWDFEPWALYYGCHIEAEVQCRKTVVQKEETAHMNS